MATLSITSSNWDVGQIRITYTASNGTLKITEIEGKRSGGYRSWDTSDTSITVSVGGISKSISLSHYVDFGNNEWTSWGATDTSWTGLTGTSISIATTMPSTTVAYNGAKFTGNATMSWSTYTVAYNANGGSGAPSSQTKTHGTALTLSSIKPTRTGYTFSKWNTKSDGSGTSYSTGASYTSNSDVTLYAIWTENVLTVNYYSNYADYGTLEGKSLSVSANNNVLVNTNYYYYDNSYSSGLDNVQNSNWLYLSKTGYTPTGKWGTSTSGGTLVDHNTSFSSGQALARALGKDLSNGNASINVYPQWTENTLTVYYYSNYATESFADAENTVGSDKNVIVRTVTYLYDNEYPNGHWDYSYSGASTYLGRTGYTATEYWGTSTSGGTLVNQSTSYSSGQTLAEAVGKSLKTGNASVNLYPQWTINTYTIAYNANDGTGTMSSQNVNWNDTFILSNNAFEREGYKFIGWNSYRDNDGKWYVNGQGWLTQEEIDTNGYEKKVYENQDELIFDMSWILGNEKSIHQYTMYAIWEISGVVYIDNGTTFEPYLTYIYNGSGWDLYLAYIDNGTELKIIS